MNENDGDYFKPYTDLKPFQTLKQAILAAIGRKKDGCSMNELKTILRAKVNFQNRDDYKLLAAIQSLAAEGEMHIKVF